MKILVVLSRFPYPLEKGDKLRAYHQIRTLSQNNEVSLFCVCHETVLPEHIDMIRPFCKNIKVVHSPKLSNYKNVVRNFFYAKSLQIGYWDSKKARKCYNKFEQEVGPDVIYSQMVRTMTWVSHSKLPKVMDFQDALSMNTERRMEHAHGLMKYLLHFEFKMLRSSEYNSFKIFDALTIISETDSEAIPHRKNSEIRIVPNGVDFNFYNPQDSSIKKLDKHYDLLFCGNMQYHPNISASKFLVEEVMPLVWRDRPQTTLLLAGATPVPAVKKLQSDRVMVSGWMDDIRTAYASSNIFVAPMQVGSGLQNKLLEAMAMGLPCVTTPIANAALHGEHGTHLLVGKSARELADQILSLLDNEELSKRLAQQGNEFVHTHFSWEAAGNELESILCEATNKHI